MNQAVCPPPEAPSDRSDSSPETADTEPTPDHTQIFVVDDHPAIREALASAVAGKTGMQIVGDSARATEALPQVERLTPDVVVVDISLEDEDGLTLVQRIRSRVPTARILIFSMYDEDVYAERALRAGASGYVMKSEPTQKIVRAIEEVSEGQVYLSRHITSHILSKVIRTEDYTSSSHLEELTDRELTVFRRLGEGHTVRQIADQLDLNRKTVETYRRRAKEKLGHDTVDGLLQHAVQWTGNQGTTPSQADDPA